MMTKKLILSALFTLLFGALSTRAQTASDIEQLKRQTQELLDAVAPGNVAVWQKYLAAGCLYTDEEGNVKTKADLLKELQPLPQGYVGSIKMGEPHVFQQDNVVVLSHRDRESLTLFGQTIITWFHITDTWVKQADGQWRLAASHVVAIPNERKPVTLSVKQLDEYAGQYQIAPEVFYTIMRTGNQLFGQRTGRGKESLLVLHPDVLYRKGVWRGEKVFERDAQGKVIRMLDRRENNDLVWRKVK